VHREKAKSDNLFSNPAITRKKERVPKKNDFEGEKREKEER